jgi:ABC-type multidrug transport system ATPase subunit
VSDVKRDVLLEIRNVTKVYRRAGGDAHALGGVSLDIYRGEVLGLLGVNGAGKTTLSSIIGTFHPATSGDVLYKGVSIYKMLLEYRSILGFCPQKPNLDSALTVRENLIFAGRYYLQPEEFVQTQTDNLIKRFGFGKYAGAKVSELSGGYKQRLSIARALMNKPELIIFDEPTVALDPHIRRDIWKIIRELKAEGITVILTTHYLDEAEELSDRVCILEQGHVRLVDTPDNLKKMHAKENLEDVFLHVMGDESNEGV